MKKQTWNEMDTTSKGIAVVACAGLAYSVGTFLYEMWKGVKKNKQQKNQK